MITDNQNGFLLFRRQTQHRQRRGRLFQRRVDVQISDPEEHRRTNSRRNHLRIRRTFVRWNDQRPFLEWGSTPESPGATSDPTSGKVEERVLPDPVHPSPRGPHGLSELLCFQEGHQEGLLAWKIHLPLASVQRWWTRTHQRLWRPSNLGLPSRRSHGAHQADRQVWILDSGSAEGLPEQAAKDQDPWGVFAAGQEPFWVRKRLDRSGRPLFQPQHQQQLRQ